MVGLRELDNPVWLGEWQWTKKHAVNDGENRGVCANAQSEGEYGNGRKAGIFPEHARGISQVLPDG